MGRKRTLLPLAGENGHAQKTARAQPPLKAAHAAPVLQRASVRRFYDSQIIQRVRRRRGNTNGKHTENVSYLERFWRTQRADFLYWVPGMKAGQSWSKRSRGFSVLRGDSV